MTDVIDEDAAREELVVFLRNSDIFTTTQRGVTTRTDTGTFSSDDTHTLGTNPTRARNVRSVVIDAVTKSLGTDYTVNYETGVISFVSSESGDYTIKYDEGTSDKIHPDFPRPDLGINSFPRIGIDFINYLSTPGGLGNVNITDFNFTVIVYDKKTRDISDYIKAIRTAFIDAHTSFYYIGIVTKPTNVGPFISSPREKGKDKILQKNIDFISRFKYENN